jgi:polysaccharide pyruvyl transferase WcaK-like protein
MYGCGIGPINYAYNRRRAHRTINRAVDVITLRDQSSLEELSGMGIDQPVIMLSADPTVTLPAAPTEVADSLLEAAGLSPADGQHYLGISVRPWPGFEEKAAEFAQAADYAYETYGLIPVFLPIEARIDIDAAKQVARQIKHAPYAILQGCACSQQTIALFSRMDVVLSMRLHALVFSAGHGVPLVGAVYDPKVSSFLDALGQDLYTPFYRLTANDLKAHLDVAVARTQDRSLLEAGAQKLLQLEKHNAIQARRLLEIE